MRNREVLVHSVASDYFATLKMPLARGREWSASDDARAEGVTVINETMARQLWPNEDPIGKRVRDRSFVERRPQWVLNAPGRDGWFEVIGVVRDAPNRGLREPIAPAMYYPYTAALSDVAVLLVRTRGNPLAAERGLRTAVSRADASLPIIRFITPETFMGWQQGEFVTAVLLWLWGSRVAAGLVRPLQRGVLFDRPSHARVRHPHRPRRGAPRRAAFGHAVARGRCCCRPGHRHGVERRARIGPHPMVDPQSE